MKTGNKEVQGKITDYTRFFMTLMIVSTYAYLGTFIHYFVQPVQNGEWLVPILLVSLAGAGVYVRLLIRLKASPDNQTD